MTLNNLPEHRWGERLPSLYDLQVLLSGARSIRLEEKHLGNRVWVAKKR